MKCSKPIYTYLYTYFFQDIINTSFIKLNTIKNQQMKKIEKIDVSLQSNVKRTGNKKIGNIVLGFFLKT